MERSERKGRGKKPWALMIALLTPSRIRVSTVQTKRYRGASSLRQARSIRAAGLRASNPASDAGADGVARVLHGIFEDLQSTSHRRQRTLPRPRRVLERLDVTLGMRHQPEHE